MRHTVRIAVVVAMVVAAGVVVSSRVPARALQGVQTGYWWQGQPDGAPLPPPPTVPANGLWISGSDANPVAISAVRFRLASTETAPVLTAKVNTEFPPAQASSQLNAGEIVVVACPTTRPWAPAQAGAWSARPAFDCTNAVHGAPSSDGTTITFDLGPLAANGTVDVALVPGTGAATLPNVPVPFPVPGVPATPQPSGFDVTLQPITPDQVRVSPAEGETAADTGGSTPPVDTTAPLPDLTTTQALGSMSSAPPEFNFAANAVVPSTGTAASSTPSVNPGSLAPQTANIGESTIKDNKAYRWLAGILLAVLLWWAWRQAMPPRRARRTIYDGPSASTA